MPNLYLTLVGLAFSISQSPETDKLIAKSGKKHKFWDFEAQIAQIEHKLSTNFSTHVSPPTPL